MCDYSEAELTAHREQAWTRWVKDHKHGLSTSEADTVLILLRACAWAQPGEDEDLAALYKLAVNDLKQSDIWKNHLMVRQWLSTKWLNIPKVSTLRPLQMNDFFLIKFGRAVYRKIKM